MYPVDRRKLAVHVYALFQSLRKSALILQVSHTTVARWIAFPERKLYCKDNRSNVSKTSLIVETIKIIIQNDPFVSLFSLRNILKNTLGVSVSKELDRTILFRSGMSKKKTKFFGQPQNLETKVKAFLEERNKFKQQGRPFVSMDETSFGRNGVTKYGYSPRGKPLLVRKASPRTTTSSVLAVASPTGLLKTTCIKGSYNTGLFVQFLETLDLSHGTVILLDNVAFHHSKLVKLFAISKGWDLLYTPPYCPWFNPIEGIFSIVKRSYYKGQSIEQAFQTVEQRHCQAFFDKSLSIENQF
jgi:transposase